MLPPYNLLRSALPLAPLLVLLHGTGGTENDLLSVGKTITGGQAHLLGIRGSVIENGHTNRFFRRLSSGVFDEADVNFRADELVKNITQIVEKEGITSKEIYAIGYSNGANIAGAILLKYPDFFTGAILWRAMRPLPELPQKSSTTKVLLISGESDGYYQPETMEVYIESLKGVGMSVQHVILPNTGHSLVTSDLRISEQFWAE